MKIISIVGARPQFIKCASLSRELRKVHQEILVQTMIKKARNMEEIRVVDDMVMSPTYTRDAAGRIRDILMEELPSGIYHVANSGFCSWFEFAKAIFDTLDIDANLLPIKTSALVPKAKRPMFSALVSSRLGEYGLGMPCWEYGLKNYLNEKGYFKSAGKTGR